jgi:hypothetical protein
VLDILNENLLVSNTIIIKNESQNKQQNKNKINAKVDTKPIEDTINVITEYKAHLNSIKQYFNTVYQKSHIDRVLLGNRRKLNDMGCDGIIKLKLDLEAKFLGKKAKRYIYSNGSAKENRSNNVSYV